MRAPIERGKPARVVDEFGTNAPVDLRPDEDFSPEAAAKREAARRLDFRDTRRELESKAAREQRASVLPVPIPRDGDEQYAATGPSFYQRRAQELVERETSRRSVTGFDSLPIVKEMTNEAARRGVQLNASDIRNLVDFGVLNAAADRVVLASQAGDRVAARNVYLTLEETNPVMASILPQVVEQKIAQAVQDPSVVDNLVKGALDAIGYVISPFVAANDFMTEGVRAGSLQIAEDQATPGLDFGPLSFARGFVSPQMRGRVQAGMLNETYLQEIRESGEYDPLAVDIVADIVSAAQAGDPDAIINVWQDKYSGDENAARIVRDIMYSKGDSGIQELVRQVSSAGLGDTGQVAFGSTDLQAEYDPDRGSEIRERAASVAGFGVSVAVDPTLLLGRAGKLLKAAKWGLERLAPGAPASAVLTQARFGRLAVSNPAYRYFDNFANDLNALDDLERRAAAAAAAGSDNEALRLSQEAASYRNRMTRQYDEMPEDLIEDFRTSPWRTPDGKFTVETIAAAIDDMNDAYIVTVGGVAEKLAAQGATQQAIKAAQQELLAQRSFYGRVVGQNQKRTPLVPRMSLAAQIRKDAVNRLAFAMIPQAKATALVTQFLNQSGLDAKLFSQALSDSAVPFGTANRNMRWTTGTGWVDSTGRLFSSIPTITSVSVATAEDAQQVYRYARLFFPRRTSEMIADAFRRGDEGSRRLLLSGLVRSAAASRGLTMTAKEADGFVRQLDQRARGLMTGSMEGERYGVTVPAGELPTQRAGLTGADEALDVDADVPLRSLSADANGIEHALHLDQTAGRVALPTLKDFEDLRGSFRMKVGLGAGKAVDYWSIGTLFGLRFSMRNAIEEVGLYWLTGGGMADLVRGRRASQAIRSVRPRIYIQNVNNKPEVVLKTSLGMFANKAEWTNRWMRNKGFPEWMAELVFRGTDEEALKAAGLALADGDSEAFARLAVQSIARQRVFGFRTNLTTEEDRRALEFLVDSTHGVALMDEIAEASPYLNSGGFPAYASKALGVDDAVPGVEFGRIRDFRFGDYMNVRPLGRDEAGRNLYGLAFWWRELQRTLVGDGDIGEAAVRLLNKPDRAKAEIARIIREDKTFGYKQKFSRLRSDADVDQFASDYFENVFQHFTRADGTLNMELRNRFISIEDGAERATFWKGFTDEEMKDWSPEEVALAKNAGLVGSRVNRVDLADIPVKDRPAFIFGRDVINEPYIPMPMDEPALFSVNRAYGWMGRQNARISREPIFLANYMNQFKQMRGAREMLAKSLAAKRGGQVSADDLAMADRLYARQAMDNAFNLTLSYVDNPANRSNLAWKARNVARYYRASEDFYRRVKRVALNDPLALWKGALTYQLLGDFGFVTRNDDGEMMFAYPGNNIMQNAVAGVSSRLFGVDVSQMVDLEPFSLTGRVLGAAPSTDPNQALPSFAGPLTAPVAAIFTAFPQFEGVRALLLGTYAQSSGNPVADAFQQILPAGVVRVLRTSDPELITSQLAQAGMDTIALMTAEGMLDRFTVNGKPLTDAEGNVVNPGMVDVDQFKMTDQYLAAQSIAMGLFITKAIGGFILPAAPQASSNTSSNFAKRYGIDSMDDAFKDLLDKHKDEPFPYERALSEFYALKVPGATQDGFPSWASMLPFTTSQFKVNPDKTSAGLAGVRATDAWLKWMREPSTQDLKSKYGDVYQFLAPREGEFSWPAWNAMKNVERLQVRKSEDEAIADLFAIQGRITENQIRADYRRQIDAATSVEQAAALVKERDIQVKSARSLNPYWLRETQTQDARYGDGNLAMVLYRTKDMLQYLRKRDGKLDTDAQLLESAIDVYSDYKGRASGLIGTAQQRRAAKDALLAEMGVQLESIKAESKVAAQFIEAVLEADPDFTFGVQ